ncbi:hypothetical protein HYY71_03515 [Candidatus Woesearchaeota archaeon]|nr:hypothetical protein [Candidatus Woesearchaeota archaeon]
MPEIRFGITKKLNDLLVEISNEMGVDKSDYVKSLILADLKNRVRKK